MRPLHGLVQWRDPKLAAGVLVAKAGRILLVQRNHEPGLGLWSFPSGFVDRGEVVEEAAAREAMEEAGVPVAVGALLGCSARRVIRSCSSSTRAPRMQDRCPVPRRLPPRSSIGLLPPLAFEHDAGIIARWVSRHPPAGASSSPA
ncbi:MAG: NUDIX domain-containing protein [Dehalococcoidia bacterium]